MEGSSSPKKSCMDTAYVRGNPSPKQSAIRFSTSIFPMFGDFFLRLFPVIIPKTPLTLPDRFSEIKGSNPIGKE